MTTWRVNIVRIVGWAQYGASHRKFAAADLNAVASQDDQSLLKSDKLDKKRGPGLHTSPGASFTVMLPSGFWWKFFLLGLNVE